MEKSVKSGVAPLLSAGSRQAAPARAWQRMLSGRRLDLLDPSPLDVEIEDIAHGLARVARWNGQTLGDHAFSVAQHSCMVEAIFAARHPDSGPEERLYALLHDAGEYVIGDMISPFKAALGYDYKAFEERLEAAVHLRFGLKAHPPEKLRRQIKEADRISAYFEAVDLAGFTQTEARRFFGQPLIEIERPLVAEAASQAQSAFLARFETLMTGLP
jgi:uncharacterized protein